MRNIDHISRREFLKRTGQASGGLVFALTMTTACQPKGAGEVAGAARKTTSQVAAEPFDAQAFDLEFQSFLWDRHDVVFVVNEEQTGFDPDYETPEWSVTGRPAPMAAAIGSSIR